jgi:hypothetical protein
MSEGKDASKASEIRVIDRRMFTPEGERRTPDAPAEDSAPAPPVDARRATGPAAAPPPASREEQAAGAHFKNLVLNLATTAAANLGEIPNPFSRQTEVDLEGARQVIDLLQALGLKTRGNLTAEEQELLESLLYDLKAKYVAMQSKAARRP